MAGRTIPGIKKTQQPEPGLKYAAGRPESFAVEVEQSLSPHRHINWSLLLGALIVFLVVLLAVAGPRVAPRDPMEENVILQINGKWLVPPLPLFTPGFPLGSDDFGRDLYSRALWGIRPTLIMVTVVAVIRLLIGIVIGLTAGWTSGRLARSLDTLIELALAIPVLLVALCVIAIVGVELGIWAFILGLAVTGWVETAQQVREQTRIVRGQSYIEAARSLGARNQQILTRHVRKQITPLLVMLFAFEMSSTLMTTAGLGFLGYYIGGDVWVTVDDFVARRISGMPELGQMLATSWITLTRPWAMVVVGTLIFIAILGFNLLGDGLRQNLEIIRVGRRSVVRQLKDKGVHWLDQNIWHPLAQVTKAPSFRLGVLSGVALLLLVLVIGLSFLRWFEDIPAVGDSSLASKGSESLQGTSEIQSSGRSANPVDAPAENGLTDNFIYAAKVIWEFEDESGFDGGLALSNDHSRIYALSKAGILYAFDLEGKPIWQVQMPAGGVGTPAVASSGAILAADKSGGLTRVDRQGGIEWHFQTSAGDHAHSGPVLDRNENIYYTAGTMAEGFVQSVSAQGADRWVTQANTNSFLRPPVLSADGEYVYLRDDIFSAETGESLALTTDLKVLGYFSGKDQKDYLLSGNNIIHWQPAGNALQVLDIAEWDTSELSSAIAPTQVGVTEDGTGWMLYTSPGGATQIVWVTLDDQTIGEVNFDQSSGILIDNSPDRVAYICGGESFDQNTAECAAFKADNSDPLWRIDLGNTGLVEGGLWNQGRLYITTSSGKLLAIQETAGEVTASSLPTNLPVESASVAGLSWTYTFPEKILAGILPLSDSKGSWYGLTENLTLQGLNSDGSLKYSTPLPTGLFKLVPEEVNGYLFPAILPDGTVIVVSDQNTVYAIGTDGSIKWEHPFDAEPSAWPVTSDTGTLYILDKAAGLHAFDANGLKWTFHSSAAANTATGPEIGPDGSVYYTVTDLSKGIVQAVTPEGQELWNSPAKTTLFYDPLVVSPDGKYVYLKDEIFDAQTGEMVEYQPPSRVDRFVAGYDGRVYLISGESVMEWLPGPSGFEAGRSVAWDTSNRRYNRPIVQVDKNQVIWLNFFEQVLWLDFNGNVLGEITPTYNSGSINGFDLPNGRFIECQRDRTSEVLTCTSTQPGIEEPVWEVEVPGVPDFEPGQAALQDGHLYVLSENQSFSKYFVGGP